MFGVHFLNPLGIAGMDSGGYFSEALANEGFGFVVTGPFFPEKGNESILRAISGLKLDRKYPLAATLSKRPGDVDDDVVLKDYLTPFSLLYDFVDFFIVGMDAPQIDSIADILDELLALRLCYEHFKPILLHIPAKTPPDELEDILSFCMLSGIDGIVAEGAPLVGRVLEHVSGKLPVIGSSCEMTPQEAVALRQAGASLVMMDGNWAKLGRRAPVKILKALKNNPLQQ